MKPSVARLAVLATLSEKEWRAQVMRWAQRARWQVWFTWSSIHSPAGLPDLILCRPPRLLFVELKTEHGQLTRAQEEGLALLNGCPGIETYVWRPHDEQFVQETLL